MKLATSLAALVTGMLVVGACADEDVAGNDAYRDTQEAQRDRDPLDSTYPAMPSPNPVTPANPDDAVPPPPTPGDPPPPLPPN